jgi:hypothetical protein
MPANAITIISGVLNAFENDITLQGYIDLFEMFEDEFDIVERGLIPFINIKSGIPSFRVTTVDNKPIHNFQRHVYPLIITFGNRGKTGKAVVKGEGSKKGLWDMCEDIRAVINADPTFGGVVEDIQIFPEIGVNTYKHESGRHWIGQGAMKLEVCKDYCRY